MTDGNMRKLATLPGIRSAIACTTVLLLSTVNSGCAYISGGFPGFASAPTAEATADPQESGIARAAVKNQTTPAASPPPIQIASQSGRSVLAANPQPVSADTLRQNQTLRALAATPSLSSRGYWTRVSREFKLARNHPEVSHWAWHYARQPERMRRIFSRGGPYLWQIEKQLRRKGMPLELVLLPALESGYNPNAVSSSGAIGLWQFLPATGNRFGLNKDWWYDGKRDFIASTAAALEYLDFLYSRFENWPLAIAAYNCGEGCMSRAMTASRSYDFWGTQLPKQTREYIPKLLGMAELIANPERYDFYLDPLPDGQQLEVVQLPGQTEFALVAKWAGIELATLKELNAGFQRSTTPPNGPHRVVVPAGRAGHLRNTLAVTPGNRLVSTREHRVVSGDTLSQIARKYGVRPTEIQRINKLSGNLIKVGQILAVPTGAQPAAANFRESAVQHNALPAAAPGAARSGRHLVHHVASGDSLWYIAQLYSVDSNSIAVWNNMAAQDALRPGQRLNIYQSGVAGDSDALFYQVRAGDSLPIIASRFGVTVADIMRWNIIERSDLQPGQRLRILKPG